MASNISLVASSLPVAPAFLVGGVKARFLMLQCGCKNPPRQDELCQDHV